MPSTQRFLLAAAAFSLLLATALGAYGTHGLQGTLSATAWSAYETAIRYQFYHGLGMIGTTLLAGRYPDSRAIAASGWLLLAGIVLFCGSIYATSFGAPAAIGGLAPAGGTAFMAGWLALGVGVLRARS
ncbi:MAG: DUF423 domain-containing protein [Candidatus Rariloculaceae bacterium]